MYATIDALAKNFGVPLPTEDLLISLALVLGFIPAVFIVHRLIALFVGSKPKIH